MTMRKTCVAGKFYPSTHTGISELIGKIMKMERDKLEKSDIKCNGIIGGVVPHAGYVYSGFEAVHFFNKVSKINEKYDSIVIITPNHTGYGERISVENSEEWETPYGAVKNDLEFVDLLANDYKIPVSNSAQLHEHSGEVMLPFLKYFFEYEFKIIPINMLIQNHGNAVKIADAIFEANKKLNRKLLVIASSDFSHYMSAQNAELMDVPAINLIRKLDSEGFYRYVYDNDVSICGYGPIIALMEYTKKIVNSKIELLRYGNSGETSKDFEKVVSYASMLAYY